MLLEHSLVLGAIIFLFTLYHCLVLVHFLLPLALFLMPSALFSSERYVIWIAIHNLSMAVQIWIIFLFDIRFVKSVCISPRRRLVS